MVPNGCLRTLSLTPILARISNYIHQYTVWDEIIYTFPNINGTTVEVWKCISTLIWYLNGRMINFNYIRDLTVMIFQPVNKQASKQVSNQVSTYRRLTIPLVLGHGNRRPLQYSSIIGVFKCCRNIILQSILFGMSLRTILKVQAHNVALTPMGDRISLKWL